MGVGHLGLRGPVAVQLRLGRETGPVQIPFQLTGETLVLGAGAEVGKRPVAVGYYISLPSENYKCNKTTTQFLQLMVFGPLGLPGPHAL